MAFADQILDVHEIDGGFWSFNPTMDEFEYDDDDPLDRRNKSCHPFTTIFHCASLLRGVLRFNS